ncbi:predicted protein [Micromonas commoda]|uniref:Uncharacterized protein n=1 Tax=Micromonas commoda (strain RCC299 / NOUM17 / CCMP2709) TaxID=296587 RepID=C1E0A0_MICCC|nr:predicted protein [Micromonas commoda]ACO60779.1 predicted protein [Micromonas commoda]|eukprot:XP_002499521.1 predicted protein [Micromonas commoda]
MWQAWHEEQERRRSWGEDTRRMFDERYRRRSDPSALCDVPPPPSRVAAAPPPSSSYPPSQLQQAPRPPVSPARAGIDYQDAPSPSPFAIQRPADTSRWSPALRLIDDPVFQAAAEAPEPSPRSWNPPPPPLKSQPRKRKLTSDAEHTLFRPGYVPLDPEETSRGARDILAAVNARAAARKPAKEASGRDEELIENEVEASFDGLP